MTALVEHSGPKVLLHNHGALANSPLANKTAFIHPLYICMNHCRVHQSTYFCLHSPCRILLSPTLLQRKSSLTEDDREAPEKILEYAQQGEPSSCSSLGWNLLV